jgi:hypothetical protein
MPRKPPWAICLTQYGVMLSLLTEDLQFSDKARQAKRFETHEDARAFIESFVFNEAGELTQNWLENGVQLIVVTIGRQDRGRRRSGVPPSHMARSVEPPAY